MMTFNRITRLQKFYGFDGIQNLINNGQVWSMEGSMGREASRLLGSGACMLPKVFKVDYYGNRIPSIDVVKKGSKGSFKNSQDFWDGVDKGTIEIFDESFEDNEY